jgi:hypothetical protein
MHRVYNALEAVPGIFLMSTIFDGRRHFSLILHYPISLSANENENINSA